VEKAEVKKRETGVLYKERGGGRGEHLNGEAGDASEKGAHQPEVRNSELINVGFLL